MLTYIGMCRGQRLTSGFCPLLLLYLTLYRVFPEPGVFFQLNWLGSKPPGSDVFSPLKPNPHWGYRHTLSCPDFISVLGNLNSGPHTEPCPHPPVHSFKISYLSLFYVCGCFTCMCVRVVFTTLIMVSMCSFYQILLINVRKISFISNLLVVLIMN